MPIIEVIGFDDFAEIKLIEVLKEKEYYEKIFLEKHCEPYASCHNMKSGKRSAYFVVKDERNMKERAEDIMEAIEKAYPKHFVGIMYFDKTNLEGEKNERR